jgi:hypothetical protein
MIGLFSMFTDFSSWPDGKPYGEQLAEVVDAFRIFQHELMRRKV